MSARILVVDDILPNVKLLEAKLSKEYYTVITAMSGQEALDQAQAEKPDIILLDVMMPGMDGFEVCKKLKSNPDLAHVPVVMVTALTETEDKVKGLEAGADDFLSKPVNDVALFARVRSLVRLKMSIDEWRAREGTASDLGVTGETTSMLSESIDNAKILLIEDMEFDVDKIQSTIKGEGYDPHIVPTGMDAMGKVREIDYDLIIVSLDLQEEDGLRLCSHLISFERTRNSPILMIGSEDEFQKVARGMEIGAHDYIMRPLDKNELMARVRTQLRRKRYQDKLKSNYEMNLNLAVVDTLTGLYNRRYFEVHIEKLLKEQTHSEKPLGLLYLDIDHFKIINDTHGHGVGDEVLKIFGERVKNSLRSFDLVARLGGEEFVTILPNTDDITTQRVAERLRAAFDNTPFKNDEMPEALDITASIGAVTISDPNSKIPEILEKADQQLYLAKENGRNCIYFNGEKVNVEELKVTDRSDKADQSPNEEASANT